MFERETRREKILEARNKELRLKEKTKGILGLGGGGLMGGGGGGGGAFGNVAASTLKKPQDAKGGKEEQASGGPGGQGQKQEEEVDPIAKAEKEFFDIIKSEQDARLEQRTKKPDADKDGGD